MIYGVTYSNEAKADLVEILEFIAGRSSLVIAERFTDAVVKTCESLALAPHRGTNRNALRLGLRTVGFRRRVTIAFHVREREVRILRILYGGRSLDKALEEIVQ